jgi:hypothetical protein
MFSGINAGQFCIGQNPTGDGQAPRDEWARRQCEKKLARLILELCLDVARRKQLYALISIQ